MIGTAELVLILCVALLLFGGKRLPGLAKSLGQGLREFKKALHGEEEECKEEIVIEPKTADEKEL